MRLQLLPPRAMRVALQDSLRLRIHAYSGAVILEATTQQARCARKLPECSLEVVAKCMRGWPMNHGASNCMGPVPQYKLSSACQNARIPQSLLNALRNEHGSLHDPCSTAPSTDSLFTPWSSTYVNFVNPPFLYTRVAAKNLLLRGVSTSSMSCSFPSGRTCGTCGSCCMTLHPCACSRHRSTSTHQVMNNSAGRCQYWCAL
jgi:hypothetical protein